MKNIIALLQQNYTVGAIPKNAAKVIQGYLDACKFGAKLVATPELPLPGYTPGDLLLKPHFIELQLSWLREIAKHVGNTPLTIGAATPNKGPGKPLFNSALFMQNGRIWEERQWDKRFLPTYGIFDEGRYFAQGKRRVFIFEYLGIKIAVVICEDIWGGVEIINGNRLYENDPVEELVGQGVKLLIVINASPYRWGKGNVRFDLVSGIAKKLHSAVAYCNTVGANTEIILDGRSFLVDRLGRCIGAAKPFEEEVLLVDLGAPHEVKYHFDQGSLGDLENALVLGTRDYVKKSGFEKVVIASSGGIDSALTDVIACKAVGPKRVVNVAMPTPWSSPDSLKYARQLADNLGVAKFYNLGIDGPYDAFGKVLEHVMDWGKPTRKRVTRQNVQARIRMALIMALSNEFGWLVLNTSNKSESAVGYATLYGDTAGGLGLLKDVWKTLVYELANWANRDGILIPKRIIERPPTAELAPDQLDTDSLPPYDILDPILEGYIEDDLSVDDIARRLGHKPDLVRRVTMMVDRNEYKRRQTPPGLIVTSKSFGPDRRMPIVAEFL